MVSGLLSLEIPPPRVGGRGERGRAVRARSGIIPRRSKIANPAIEDGGLPDGVRDRRIAAASERGEEPSNPPAIGVGRQVLESSGRFPGKERAGGRHRRREKLRPEAHPASGPPTHVVGEKAPAGPANDELRPPAPDLLIPREGEAELHESAVHERVAGFDPLRRGNAVIAFEGRGDIRVGQLDRVTLPRIPDGSPAMGPKGFETVAEPGALDELVAGDRLGERVVQTAGPAQAARRVPNERGRQGPAGVREDQP